MTSSTDSAKAGFIKRFWRGEVRLVIAFWVFGIGVPVALEVLHTLLFGAEAETAATPAAGGLAALVFLLLAVAYQVVVSVGILRSAKFYIFAQTSGLKKALGYAAMIWAILVLVRFGAAALFLTFVGGLLYVGIARASAGNGG